nr:IclR family transcriptional regulator [Kibdelosporangium sp. MJ126-NF4]CEL18647.1 Transcriptional regulator, IclR family [Kibdelosporangium sp. MJ126-NF4]CTQ98131.1 Transcriptional regulator, IclR family [Kibdelosporangium sp. MJ126-NF4]
MGSMGLRRDIEMLEALAGHEAQRRGGLGVLRVATLIGREKSQVSRALRALADEGIVERDPDTLEYSLGWRLFSLVARSTQSRLVQVAEPVMYRLAHALEETCHLCVLRGQEVVTLLSVSPGHEFRAHGWEGRGVPAHCTSAGRVLLMDATPDELHVRFPSGEFPPSEHGMSVRTVAELWTRIARAREHGFAAVDEEFEPGLVGTSAPIHDFRGRVRAALNVSAPKQRLGDRLIEAARETARATSAISELLGWLPRKPS